MGIRGGRLGGVGIRGGRLGGVGVVGDRLGGAMVHVSDGVVEEVSVYDGGSAGTAHRLRSLLL